MNAKSDKRKFERLPIDFVLEVISKDLEGKEFVDKAVLEDVSGDGAKFLTKESDRYFPGQELNIKFFLPGTEKMKVRMGAKATVVRIDPSDDSEKGCKSSGCNIAVNFKTHLNFERIDI
jgi:hypothetical protein